MGVCDSHRNFGFLYSFDTMFSSRFFFWGVEEEGKKKLKTFFLEIRKDELICELECAMIELIKPARAHAHARTRAPARLIRTRASDTNFFFFLLLDDSFAI